MASYQIDATVRGPARWKRAMLNATARPESGGAKLYNKRVEVADFIANEMGLLDRVSCFWRKQREYGISGRGYPVTPKRQYYTCGTRCTALQAALDFDRAARTVEDDYLSIDPTMLVRYMVREDETEWAYITNDHPTRKVRCQVCATTINPNGTVGETPQLPFDEVEETPAPEPVPAGTTWLVGPRGEMLRPEEVRVLRLTEREQFLMGMATAEMRIAFADQYGESLA